MAYNKIVELLGAGYGVFSGARLQWARLHFTPEAAQWVQHEQWHPKQETLLHDDGSLTVRLPYADATEQVAREKHCAFADVYHLWQQLAARKKPEDLLGNNINHPNDYGHWIYFRALLSLRL